MKSLKNWPLIILWLLSVLALLPISPIIQHTPPRDSGIFLYIGSRILKGEVLYRDVWDDKPPMIFLINALGLLISGGSRWGVWALEVISLFTAVLIAFSVMRRAFGITAGALGIASGITILFLTLHGGNYTEQYAIPFQFACLFFLVQAERNGGVWYAFGCGALIGILFFIRQNLISVGVAIGLYLAIRGLFSRSWNPFRKLAFIFLGFVGICLVFLLYFMIQGTLFDFWDATFIYTFIYTDLGLLERLKALEDALRFFNQIPFLLISIPLWLMAAVLLLLHGTRRITRILRNRLTGWILLVCGFLTILLGVGIDLLPGSQQGIGLAQKATTGLGIVLIGLAVLLLTGILPKLLTRSKVEEITYRLPAASVAIIAVAVFWYPIEIVMIGLSGRNFLHYFMSMCAVCTVLYAFLAAGIRSLFSLQKIRVVDALLVLGWCIGISLTLAYNPFNTITAMFTPGGDGRILKTVHYVVANTKPDDKVFIWGSEPVVNFLSKRSSPVAFVRPYYIKGYGGASLSAKLLATLQTNEPVLIIYTGDNPFVKIGSDHQCRMPDQELLAGMDRVMNFICAEYKYAGTIDTNGWKIYHLNK